ncbi:MAG: hypothetical protein WBE58_12325 [Verrucomicrobiales bacterium]
MSTAKSMTEEQIAQVRQWAADGATLQDIQQRLVADLEIRVTFLETRFLLEDLKIELIPEPEPEAEEKTETETPASPVEEDTAGKIVLKVDELQRPGTLVSGKVTFAGGQTAQWALDQFGRFSFQPDDLDFRPEEEEMVEFQNQVSLSLRRLGF